MTVPEGLYRSYSGGAVKTTLAQNISESVTSIPVLDASTFPTASGDGATSPKWAAVVLDRGEVNEETIFYAPKSGNTLQNCIRGADGTQASTHAVGATVEHTFTALDFREANKHITDQTTTAVPHSQHVSRFVNQTISASHSHSGNNVHNGTETFNGTVTGTGPLDLDSGHFDTATGDTTATGHWTFQQSPVLPAPGTPADLDGVGREGSGTKWSRNDHTHAFNVSAVLRLFCPAGTCREWFGDALPTETGHVGEWRFADGATVNQSQYPALYANIGTRWGTGDGSAGSFNLPNLAGRVPVGGDSGHSIGNTGGSLTHTLTVPELATHTHVVDDPGHKHAMDGDGGLRYVVTYAGLQSQSLAGPASPGVTFSDIDASATGISLENTGSSTPFNIEQPWAAVRFLVKVH